MLQWLEHEIVLYECLLLTLSFHLSMFGGQQELMIKQTDLRPQIPWNKLICKKLCRNIYLNKTDSFTDTSRCGIITASYVTLELFLFIDGVSFRSYIWTVNHKTLTRSLLQYCRESVIKKNQEVWVHFPEIFFVNPWHINTILYITYCTHCCPFVGLTAYF